MTVATEINPVSLFVRPKIASGDLPFPEQMNPVGGLRATSKTSTSISTPRPAMRTAIPAVAVCSRKKFRLHVCFASCSCYEVFALSSSDRARFTSTSAKGYYTSGTVSHGVLSACFYRADMYVRAAFIGANNKL